MKESQRNPLSSIAAWAGIAAAVVLVVAAIFFAGFFVGSSESATSVAPVADQPLHCQAQCIGQTNVSYQAWADCINSCMATGGAG